MENNYFVDHFEEFYELSAFQGNPEKEVEMFWKILNFLLLASLFPTALSHDLDHEKVFNVISRLFNDLSKSAEHQRVAIFFSEKQNDLVEKLAVRRFAEGFDLTLVSDHNKLLQAEFSMIVVFASNTNLVSDN